MNARNPLLFISLAVLTTVLTACGGGGGSTTQPTTSPPVEPPIEPPAPPPKISGLLKTAENDEELADALRAGMRQNQQLSAPTSGPDFSPAPSGPQGDLNTALESFSTTTVQEAGVDEPDPVKYDGEILYVASLIASSFTPLPTDDFSDLLPPPTPSAYRPVINLYRTDPDTASAQPVGQIEYPQSSAQLQLMLRTDDGEKQLISINENYALPDLGFLTDFSYWQAQTTQVKAWTVNDPGAPVEQFSLDIEGALLVARRVGDILYVITRFSPVVDGLIRYPSSEAQFSSNENLLASVQAADLLPEISRDQLPPAPLLSSSSCYIPNEDYAGPEPLLPSGSILTVTAIDLAAPDNTRSICLNGFASGHYVSTQSLYLTSSVANDKTLIHKIALNDGQPEYRGSGQVVGYLGTHNPAFMMSEVGDDLRVVSSTWDNRFFPLPLMDLDFSGAPGSEEVAEEVLRGRHHLTILRENKEEAFLEQISRLPNADHPAHIGKPGEDIFAARFLGDRAYVVTFQTVDPLYVIDVSNPEDPRIEGELEIPGFSTYLQPLSDNLLLGVGSEVAVDVALIQGVKVALFDVGNAENPVELGTAVIGKRGSYSPALYDHHALTLLQTDSEFRLALPIVRHDFLADGNDPTDPRSYYNWSDSALYQFSIDTVAGSLTQVGKIVSEERSAAQDYPQRALESSRSVIHNDAVYLIVPDAGLILPGSWGE